MKISEKNTQLSTNIPVDENLWKNNQLSTNIQPIDENLWKNNQLSKNIHVILISKPQTQIYNISIKKMKTFPK